MSRSLSQACTRPTGLPNESRSCKRVATPSEEILSQCQLLQLTATVRASEDSHGCCRARLPQVLSPVLVGDTAVLTSGPADGSPPLQKTVCGEGTAAAVVDSPEAHQHLKPMPKSGRKFNSSDWPTTTYNQASHQHLRRCHTSLNLGQVSAAGIFCQMLILAGILRLGERLRHPGADLKGSHQGSEGSDLMHFARPETSSVRLRWPARTQDSSSSFATPSCAQIQSASWKPGTL